VACVRVPDGRGGRHQEVRTFRTFTSGLEALADWLVREQVTRVVMEATGQQLEARLVRAGGARVRAHAGQCPPRQDPPGSQDRLELRSFGTLDRPLLRRREQRGYRE
jgi:hypothetical protein